MIWSLFVSVSIEIGYWHWNSSTSYEIVNFLFIEFFSVVSATLLIFCFLFIERWFKPIFGLILKRGVCLKDLMLVGHMPTVGINEGRESIVSKFRIEFRSVARILSREGGRTPQNRLLYLTLYKKQTKAFFTYFVERSGPFGKLGSWEEDCLAILHPLAMSLRVTNSNASF